MWGLFPLLILSGDSLRLSGISGSTAGRLLSGLSGRYRTRSRTLFPSGDDGTGPEFVSYCEHPEAIRHMMESSLLLLIIPDHKSNRSILTGKIFEYLATEKPILFLGPSDGDAARLLTLCGYQGIFGYDDVQRIRDFILKVAEGKTVEAQRASPRVLAQGAGSEAGRYTRQAAVAGEAQRT